MLSSLTFIWVLSSTKNQRKKIFCYNRKELSCHKHQRSLLLKQLRGLAIVIEISSNKFWKGVVNKFRFFYQLIVF